MLIESWLASLDKKAAEYPGDKEKEFKEVQSKVRNEIKYKLQYEPLGKETEYRQLSRAPRVAVRVRGLLASSIPPVSARTRKVVNVKSGELRKKIEIAESTSAGIKATKLEVKRIRKNAYKKVK